MRTGIFVASCHAEHHCSKIARRNAMSESPEMRVSDLGVTRLFGVKGKTILVTGGARGIGLMIAAGFVANGATVYIASRSADACETAARRLTAAGPGTCHALAADLGTETGCAALAAALKSREQALHVLVNNSGTSWGAPMATHDTKGWDKTYNLNVKGVFFLTRELLPLLDAASTPTDPARVINIGSVAGIRPQVFPTFSYDVSKAAVHHLTKKLADELSDRRSEGGHAITVNAIAPGYVPSRMSAQLEGYEEAKAIEEGLPLRRKGGVGDMAGAALFFASAAGAWITGVVLRVDGGMLSKLLSGEDTGSGWGGECRAALRVPANSRRASRKNVYHDSWIITTFVPFPSRRLYLRRLCPARPGP